MAQFNYDLVGKIGSMALIRKEDNDIDYNIFSRLSSELKPGMIWVSSGATEIGRLDYICLLYTSCGFRFGYGGLGNYIRSAG